MSVSGRGRKTVGNLHVLVQVMKVNAGLGSWGVDVRMRGRRVPLAELVRNQAITMGREAHLVVVLCCVEGRSLHLNETVLDARHMPVLRWAAWRKRRLEAQLGRTSRVTSASDHEGLEVAERRCRLLTYDTQQSMLAVLPLRNGRTLITCWSKYPMVRRVKTSR